jgi:GNAT superfamily N-acetyltransferase
VVDEAVVIRPAGVGDSSFLTDMLVEAVNWHPLRELSRARILSTPDLAHYVTGWPREGDRGAIAEAAGAPVGAAWLRLMPSEDPGYGYVAADVPELSIGVVAAWRGRGVGRRLLRAVTAHARAAGAARISLSVERANRAKTLYEDEGFRVISSTPDTDTMILDLSASTPT